MSKRRRSSRLRFPSGWCGRLREGQGQPGGRGCRRAVDRRVRAGPEREPLQALESDVLGDVLPAAGACGGDTEGSGKGSGAGRAHRVGPDRPNGRAVVSGAGGGTTVPSRLLRLPAGAVRGRRGGSCRQRCWKKDWVIDLDIRAFFDSLDHDLVMRTVSKHTDLRWVLLYVERWLKAPLQMGDGTLVNEIGEPHRVRRSRPCWRTSSSTTR